MVKLEQSTLDQLFYSLSDGTRRSLLEALRERDRTVSELAQPFDMSLPAISKHIKVLEQAGLIARSKVGRTHWCHLNPEPLRGAIDLLAHYDFFWKRALDSLGNYAQGDER